MGWYLKPTLPWINITTATPSYKSTCNTVTPSNKYNMLQADRQAIISNQQLLSAKRILEAMRMLTQTRALEHT